MINMRGITKTFGPLVANDNVDLHVKKGEIHALLGENGAGKSTLMSILFGLYKQDSGEIEIDGKLVSIDNPNDATKYGIGMVHQHFKLVEVFTVLENIILGVEKTKKGFLTTDEAREKVIEIMNKYNLHVDLDKKISELTVGQQQKVEIVKMLFRDNNILIFDEPTAVLTPQEILELMDIIRNFAKEGKTIVLITHKLNEIKASSDRCTILRRGKKIATVNVSKVTTNEMAEMMVGRPINQDYKKEKYDPKEIVLEVKNLELAGKTKSILKDINFVVRKGEILGVAGIDGNGQTELASSISGLGSITSGNIILNDTDISKYSIRKRYEQGMSHIPEDRHKHGLVLDFSLEENLTLQNYYKAPFQKYGFLNKAESEKYADKLIEKYDIRSQKGKSTLMRSMSGGNQQKAIIAREFEKEHNLLIAFQPTRGLDVGAIETIHNELIKERDSGKAVILVSYELEEILSLSDRIIVMYEGSIIGEFMSDDVTPEKLGLYMSGSVRGDSNEK